MKIDFTKARKFDLTYSAPKISKNAKRDKVIRTKLYVNKLETECYCCGRSYRPYVNFPLIYKEHHCMSCCPEQRLSIYSSDTIPKNMNRVVLNEARDYLLKSGNRFPTCELVFNTISVGEFRKK